MEKKVPQRMCIVCRKMYDKAQLFRLQYEDGAVSVDVSGKKNGRGAYVCNTGCITNLEKTHALERTFKAKITHESCESVVKELKELGR